MKKSLLLTLFLGLSMSLFISVGVTNAEASIDYEQVRAETQRACYPLCNLREHEINVQYFPYENPFYSAQAYNFQYNPYYYGNFNGQGQGNGMYPNYNPTPQGNVLGAYQNYGQPSQYNNQGNSANPYYGVPPASAAGTSQNQQQYNPGQANTNNGAYYANNTQPNNYQYSNNVNGNNVNQPQPYYGNTNLPAAGNEAYWLFGVIIVATLGIVYWIRKIRSNREEMVIS